MLFKGYLSCKRNTNSKHTFQIMRSNTNMDEEVAESMKSFIQTSLKTIDNEVRKCNVLKDELQMCQRILIAQSGTWNWKLCTKRRVEFQCLTMYR